MATDATDRRIEETLHHAFSFALEADTRRTIDHRVQSAVRTERRYQRPMPRHSRLTLRVLAGVLAAMVLFAATAVAGSTLFSRLTGGAPLLENVWGRATEVGESVSDAGYTVTLVKVAADSDRVWVALSVSSDAGTADIWSMRITDANGVVLMDGTGAGTQDVGGETATLFGFQVPQGVTLAGPFVLEVTALDVGGVETPGSWRVTFDVPATPA